MVVGGDGPPVILRLDDPYTGAELATAPPGETTAIEADAVHDLYLVLDAGSRITEITFQP